jgi:hypothetical protein
VNWEVSYDARVWSVNVGVSENVSVLALMRTWVIFRWSLGRKDLGGDTLIGSGL